MHHALSARSARTRRRNERIREIPEAVSVGPLSALIEGRIRRARGKGGKCDEDSGTDERGKSFQEACLFLCYVHEFRKKSAALGRPDSFPD